MKRSAPKRPSKAAPKKPAATAAKAGRDAGRGATPKGLEAQVAEIKRQLEEGGAVLVDAKAIVASRFYNRFDFDLDPVDRDFASHLDSIRNRGGNEIPVLLNRVPATGKFEVVYGHRRVMACRIAGLAVKAFVRDDLDPKEIGRLQILENADRKAPSIVDRARQVLSQMNAEVWASQAELAGSVGVTAPYITMLLRIARGVPVTLQMAHPDHHRISYRQARAIAEVGERDSKELKKRIEWVRVHKGSLTASAATDYLIRGVDKKGPGAHGSWTSSKTGGTLKVRNLAPAKAKQLAARVEELLREFGLADPAD